MSEETQVQDGCDEITAGDIAMIDEEIAAVRREQREEPKRPQVRHKVSVRLGGGVLLRLFVWAPPDTPMSELERRGREALSELKSLV